MGSLKQHQCYPGVLVCGGWRWLPNCWAGLSCSWAMLPIGTVCLVLQTDLRSLMFLCSKNDKDGVITASMQRSSWVLWDLPPGGSYRAQGSSAGFGDRGASFLLKSVSTVPPFPKPHRPPCVKPRVFITVACCVPRCVWEAACWYLPCAGDRYTGPIPWWFTWLEQTLTKKKNKKKTDLAWAEVWRTKENLSVLTSKLHIVTLMRTWLLTHAQVVIS